MMMEAPAEILLVEDNQNDIDLTIRSFQMHNLSNAIRVVRDGAEALDYLFCTGPYVDRDPRPPRVVLLDLNLPKVGGLEVLRRIKDDPRTRMIPVVALTASQDDRDILECYNLGVNSYIVKPVDFSQFIEAARALGFYWLLLDQRIGT
jgi:two-component system response regulator